MMTAKVARWTGLDFCISCSIQTQADYAKQCNGQIVSTSLLPSYSDVQTDWVDSWLMRSDSWFVSIFMISWMILS